MFGAIEEEFPSPQTSFFPFLYMVYVFQANSEHTLLEFSLWAIRAMSSLSTWAAVWEREFRGTWLLSQVLAPLPLAPMPPRFLTGV